MRKIIETIVRKYEINKLKKKTKKMLSLFNDAFLKDPVH